MEGVHRTGHGRAAGCGLWASFCPQGPSPAASSTSSSLLSLPLQMGPLPAPLLAGSLSGPGPRSMCPRRVLPPPTPAGEDGVRRPGFRGRRPQSHVCLWRGGGTRKEGEGGLRPAVPPSLQRRPQDLSTPGLHWEPCRPHAAGPCREGPPCARPHGGDPAPACPCASHPRRPPSPCGSPSSSPSTPAAPSPPDGPLGPLSPKHQLWSPHASPVCCCLSPLPRSHPGPECLAAYLRTQEDRTAAGGAPWPLPAACGTRRTEARSFPRRQSQAQLRCQLTAGSAGPQPLGPQFSPAVGVGLPELLGPRHPDRSWRLAERLLCAPCFGGAGAIPVGAEGVAAFTSIQRPERDLVWPQGLCRCNSLRIPR